MKARASGDRRRGSLLRRLRTVRRRLAPLARPHRRWLIRGVLATLLVVACRLALPWPLRGALDLALDEPGSPAGSSSPLVGGGALWIGLSFIGIAVAQGFSELAQRVSFARFSIGLVHDARAAALAAVAERQPRDPERDPGDLIARVVGDTARLKAGIKGILVRATQNGVFFLGVCAVLLVIDLRLGLTFLAGGLAVGTVTAFGAVRVSRISRRLRRSEGRLASRLHRLLVDPTLSLDFDEGERRSSQAEAKTTRSEGMTLWTVHGIVATSGCSVVLLGLHGVSSGWLAPADLVTVLFYVLIAHNPTVRLSRQGVRLGRVLASAERVTQLLDVTPRSSAVVVVPLHANPFNPAHRPLFQGRHWGVLLHRQQSYLGRCIVYLRSRSLEDALDLTHDEREELWREIMPRLESALATAFAPDRLNLSQLGNRVAQVHWHVVPRYERETERIFAGHTFTDARPGKNYSLSRRRRRESARAVPEAVTQAIAEHLRDLLAQCESKGHGSTGTEM